MSQVSMFEPRDSRLPLWSGCLLAAAAFAAVLVAGGQPSPARIVSRLDAPPPPTPPEGATAAERDPGFSRGAQRRRRAVFARVTGDHAFERLGPPRPGDWLHSFPEPGQTLQEYASERSLAPSPRGNRLHLQPFDDLKLRHRRLLGRLREYLALFFDRPVELLPQRKLQPVWHDRNRGQLDAEAIAFDLAGRVPRSSLGLMGLIGGDLYAVDLNFVFGVGLFSARAGVQSLHRYGDGPLLLVRTIKVAGHELGHMLGLRHCVFYRCAMNGSNSLAELDRQPLHLCPVCLAKLRHELGFDPVQRYRTLERSCRGLGLVDQAAFVGARARQLASDALED